MHLTIIFNLTKFKNTIIYHIKRGTSIHSFHLPLNYGDHHGPKLERHHCRTLPYLIRMSTINFLKVYVRKWLTHLCKIWKLSRQMGTLPFVWLQFQGMWRLLQFYFARIQDWRGLKATKSCCWSIWHLQLAILIWWNFYLKELEKICTLYPSKTLLGCFSWHLPTTFTVSWAIIIWKFSTFLSWILINIYLDHGICVLIWFINWILLKLC